MTASEDAVSPETDTYPAPEHGWTCFHCGETFAPHGIGIINARNHFGFNVHATPGCIEKLTAPERSLLMRIRAYEEDDRRRCEEDTDLHRQIARMQADHAVALRREEEKGYARGLADAKKHPETIGLTRRAECEEHEESRAVAVEKYWKDKQGDDYGSY